MCFLLNNFKTRSDALFLNKVGWMALIHIRNHMSRAYNCTKCWKEEKNVHILASKGFTVCWGLGYQICICSFMSYSSLPHEHQVLYPGKYFSRQELPDTFFQLWILTYNNPFSSKVWYMILLVFKSLQGGIGWVNIFYMKMISFQHSWSWTLDCFL